MIGLVMKCQIQIDSNRACFIWPEAELTAGFAIRGHSDENSINIDTTVRRQEQTTTGLIHRVPYRFPGLSDGEIISLAHVEGPISATWELFSPREGTACAVRLRVKNIGERPIELGEGVVGVIEVAYGWWDTPSLCEQDRSEGARTILDRNEEDGCSDTFDVH